MNKKTYEFQVIYSVSDDEFEDPDNMEHDNIEFENIKQVKDFIKVNSKIIIEYINLFINSKTKHSEKQIIHIFFADTPFVQAINKYKQICTEKDFFIKKNKINQIKWCNGCNNWYDFHYSCFCGLNDEM